MTLTSNPLGDAPTPDEIRAAVERMVMSDTFNRSPQLGAFLRFVVEAVLHGKADRIKAYTIGVEVLRRDTRFDPQIDPIVRVEATRLRRALERYYAGPGADDLVVLDLPRGSYVPTFRRRERENGGLARLAGALVLWAGQFRVSRQRAAIGGIAVIVAALAAVMLYRIAWTGVPAHQMASRVGGNDPNADTLPSGNGMPVVYIEPMRVVGKPPARPVAAELLHAKISDAFARFDTINVVSAASGNPKTASNATAAAPTAPANNYRLSGTVDYVGGGANVWFTLTDAVDGSVVWSRTFERIAAPGAQGITEDAIVITLTNSLLQSYGVIRSRDRARQMATKDGDPRYRCILEAADAIRTADRQAHDPARDCLEHLTSLDPSFAVGFTFLALIYNREFQLRYPPRPGDQPALERALRAVRQSINLRPESSRGYLALMVIQFNRRNIAAAIAAGDKCLTLNKYDMLALGEYGGRLVLAGEVERGMRMLLDAGAHGAVRPSWHHIYMFIGTYVSGNMEQAAYQAGQIPTDNVALGQVAKVLTAHAAGKADQARGIIDRLTALSPAWRNDPRAELARLIADAGIVDRLARDLAAAGLPGRS